eukprot:g6859.t1
MLDTFTSSSSPSMNYTTQSECCYAHNNELTEKELVNAPEFSTDEFRMHHFKIDNCPRQEPHDWTVCPFAHAGEKARRRDPAHCKYAAIACIDMKKNGQCPRGDDCPYAHNVFEYWMHPTRYRTQICNDGNKCKRQICFFAHRLEELRVPPRKPGFPPEWHKGRKQKNRNSHRRKAMSTSPRNERGKGFSEPGNSNAVWQQQQDLLNQGPEFSRKACLNVPEASMDHKKAGYAMHDLVSDSRQLNDIFSPFTAIPAIRGQNLPLGIHPCSENQCSAPSNNLETSLGLHDYASKLDMVLSALSCGMEESPEALKQSSSEYAAYAPVMHTAFGGSTQHRMNLDLERQRFPNVHFSKPLVVDSAMHSSSLSPPSLVHFSPDNAPFLGLGSDQDSPVDPLAAELPSVSFAWNPLDYSRLIPESVFPSQVAHEPSNF